MAIVLKTRKRAVGVATYSKGEESHVRPAYVAKTPPCRSACPSDNDIRGFLTIIAQQEYFDKSADEAMVRELKRRGHFKANKSQLIRYALSQVDLDKVPKDP